MAGGLTVARLRERAGFQSALVLPLCNRHVGCHYCARQGRYRLARLAATFDPDIHIDGLLAHLTRNCAWESDGVTRRRPGKYDPKCGAYYPDLVPPQRPPDLPPAMFGLRVVGGRNVEPEGD